MNEILEVIRRTICQDNSDRAIVQLGLDIDIAKSVLSLVAVLSPASRKLAIETKIFRQVDDETESD